MNSFSLLKKHKDYRNFWLANFLSNLAIWIQIVGSGIYMSEQSNSPMLIASVQMMSTLPVFIFSIPFGVIADLTNIYGLLAVIQVSMTLITFLYALTSIHNLFMPEAIIIFTGLIGIATAIRLPTGQSAIIQTIPQQDIKIAAILNNFGYSMARAIGPFIAGFLFFYCKTYIVFGLVTSLFFLSSIYFIHKRGQTSTCYKINSGYLAGLSYGFKYFLNNKYLKYISLCSFIFFCFSTALWASIPYVAKYYLGVTAKTQGAMAGFIGLGSILTGIIFPKIRTKFNNRSILFLIFIGAGISLYGYLLIKTSLVLMFFCLIFFGFTWACAVSFFNGEIQSECPKELRGRLISMYFFVMYGGLSCGNFFIGKLLLFYSVTSLFQFFGISLIILGFLLSLKIVAKTP